MTLLPKAGLIALFAFACCTFPAHAERADRDKPIQIEARKITIDDAKKIQTLEGDVILTKGTIVIRAERIIITEDRQGFQKGTAFGKAGKPARIRQKREGSEEYMEGEAQRIEYNTRNEIAELFHQAWVKNGADHVRGNYILYDSISEKCMVTAGEAADQKTPSARVHAIIQTKKQKQEEPASAAMGKGEQLQLRGAQNLPATSDNPLSGPEPATAKQ